MVCWSQKQICHLNIERGSLILEESASSGKFCLNISQQNTTLTPKTTSPCDTWLMQGEEIFRDVAKEDRKVKSSVPLTACSIKETTLNRFSLCTHIRGIAICRLIRTCVPKQMPKKMDKQMKGNKQKGNKQQLKKVQLQTKIMKCFL